MAVSSTTIRILTDSRGRGLEHRILSELDSSKNIRIIFNVYPGTTLEKLRHKLPRGQAALTLIIAGICNFTTSSKEGRKRIVTYNTALNVRQERKDSIKSTILDLLDNYGSCIVSTIAPAKLTTLDNLDQKDDQQALLADLQEINTFIKEESEKRNINILNLAKTFFLSSRKRRGKSRKTVWRFAEEALPDGVHLNPKLQDRWAKIIATCITKFLQRDQEGEIEFESESE